MGDRQAPLFAQDSSTDGMDERDASEGDALLGGGRKQISPAKKRQWRELALFGWALVATIAAVILGVVYGSSGLNESGGATPEGKRNLIFMVSDGMGPSSLSMARSFRQYEEGLPYGDALILDNYVVGQSRTRSSSSLITDSAAGATAFSCGRKSYNGAISVLPDHQPCGSVLEAAKAAGYMTGLVVTTRITDATPACFASHVNMRDEEDLIAEQLLGDHHPMGRNVDLILGAGRCHFLPNTTEGSCRDDAKDLVQAAKDKGFRYLDSRREFDNIRAGGRSVKLPLLGLFADHDIPYEVDRRQEKQTYPALVEMARLAMRTLSEATRGSDKGFFLMIEGSRIDHAGHANDPVAHVHEVLAYDKAFQSVLDFIQKDSTQGLLVATSDHETGGLAVARQLEKYEYPEYLWYPSALANATHSVSWLTHDYWAYLRGGRRDVPTEQYLRDALSRHMGIHDPSDAEIADLVEKPRLSPYMFGEMISRRAQIGWSSHGHSAADVNIYSSDAWATSRLQGNVENTEVGAFLRDYLGVADELEEVTRKLQSANTAWMGAVPAHDERLDEQEHAEADENMDEAADVYRAEHRRFRRF